MEEDLQKAPPVLEKPKKKTSGCLIVLIVLFFLFVLIAVAGYVGYKKIVQSTSNPMGVEIPYSMADLEEAFANTGSTGGMCLDCTDIVYGKPHEIKTTFTNSQATAWLNFANHDFEYGELKNFQVRFTENKAELSAQFTYDGTTYPVYISGTGAKASTNSISGKLETLKVGGISLPDSVKPMVEKILVELANGRLAELGDTLRIDVLEIKEGGLHFEGLAPSTFE